MEIKKKTILPILILVFVGISPIIFLSREAEEEQNTNPSSQATQEDITPPDSKKENDAQEGMVLNVPFTAQAPLGNWSDPRQQNGCEEAATLMAMAWVEGNTLTPEEAEREITAIADYELQNMGHFHDSSAEDLVRYIFKGYFGYENVEIKYDIDAEDIKNELRRGNLILVPANGKTLNNPFYTEPPLEHMVVIRGYDSETKEFIVNDSGTSRGELFRYAEDVIMNAIYDYPTGYHEPVNELRKAMIIVKK